MSQSIAISEQSASPGTESRGAMRSLRACLQWSVIGSAVYAGCQWAILVVLAKLSSPESVGQFALGLAVTAPIMLFANLQLSGLQATDAKREFRFGHYLALRLVTTLLAVLVIAGVAFVSYPLMTALVVFTVGVAKAFEAISDAYHGLMQQHHRMERVARSQILKGTLSVIAVSAWLWFGGNILGAALALAAVWGLLMLAYDVRSTSLLRSDDQSATDPSFAPAFAWPKLGQLAWLALPLGTCAILVALSFNVPRYVVEQYLGVDQLGIFAALAYVSVVGQVLSNALGQAAAPRLAIYYAEGDMNAFRTLVFKLAGVGAVIGMGGVVLAWLAGRPLLMLLYRAEYAEQVNVFLGIMVGAALWCVATMFYYAATAARRQRSQAVAAALVVLTALTASLILVPRAGMIGASLAVAFSGASALLAFGFIFLTTRAPAAKESA